MATTVELKGPRAAGNACFEFELARQSRSDGGDAFRWFKPSTLVRNDDGLQTSNGDGRFVDDFDDDHHDVFVVIVNFHADGHEMSVQRAGTGAVVVAHHRSPVHTDG